MIQYDLLSSNLTSDEKIILSLIKSWNDDNKECFMSNPAIAQLIGLQPKNVSKKINKLKNLGLISITQIYRKNTKQIEKRILKFICYPTPSTIVDTHPQKRDTPSTIVDIPPQKEEDIILDIKLEDKFLLEDCYLDKTKEMSQCGFGHHPRESHDDLANKIFENCFYK